MIKDVLTEWRSQDRSRWVFLVPLWYVYLWWVGRWVGHDCDRQRVTCALPSSLWLGWLDRLSLKTP